MPITIGASSEEALEACHTTIRYLRKYHTCKISRKRLNEDLFKWLLIISDPIIAKNTTTYHKKNSKNVKKDVLSLLPHLIYSIDKKITFLKINLLYYYVINYIKL